MKIAIVGETRPGERRVSLRAPPVCCLRPAGAADAAVPAGAKVIDVRGKFITPGFVDTHAHWEFRTHDVLEPRNWSLIANLAYGVTAGLGGLAYAGIRLTHREINSAVTFLTGHDAAGGVPAGVDWPAIAKGWPGIGLYMGLKPPGPIAAAVTAGGRGASRPRRPSSSPRR